MLPSVGDRIGDGGPKVHASRAWAGSGKRFSPLAAWPLSGWGCWASCFPC